MSTFGEELDHTPLDFGKHNGRTPSDISEDDPGYIVWMADNMPNAPVSPALVKACREAQRDLDAEGDSDCLDDWRYDRDD